MATRESMLQNYSASASYATANYDAEKSRMPGRYGEGIQRTFGVSPGPRTMQKYSTKIQNARHRMGDPNYWLTRTIEGLSK